MGHETIELPCDDGIVLVGQWWAAESNRGLGTVVINCATGVRSRYYHRYAAFLTAHGFHALTYDYRGIGLSRPASLRADRHGWTQWGEQDIEAALGYAQSRSKGLPTLVVGHSIGGFLPGYARRAASVSRMLTVGAQYAYWRDYAPAQRLRLLAKWHVAMPVLTAANGYFPGKRLGWLEDLPSGVAYEWGFRRSRVESRLNKTAAQDLVHRFASVAAPILTVGVSDDPFGTRQAISRALRYYTAAEHYKVMLEPADLNREQVGHFDLFHDRHAAGFWLDSLLWLRDGINPWPHRVYV